MSVSTSALKLYGERNTGTTYLSVLLARNLDVRLIPGIVPKVLLKLKSGDRLKDLYFRTTLRRNLGWKHAIAPSAKRLAELGAAGVGFVTLTKNPYSWLLSLHRRPYHGRRDSPSFDAFLISPWETVGRELAPESFANPVELWNAKNRSYLGLGEAAPCLNLRYEDLLRDPERVIGEIADRFGLARKGSFANVERGAKGQDRHKSHDDYRRYYLDELWKKEFTPERISQVNRFLDRDVVRAFAYEELS